MAAELDAPQPTVMTMTMENFTQETTTEINTLDSSETISKTALAAAEAASTAATEAAASFPSLQTRMEAARDVAVAFQQAAAACAELQAFTLSPSTEENKKLHDESTTQIQALNTQIAAAKAKNEPLTSNERVNTAFVAAQSAVNSALEKIEKVNRATKEFTREYTRAVEYMRTLEPTATLAFRKLEQSKLDTLQTDLSTVKTTAGKVTTHITLATGALETARQHSNAIPDLMNPVTDTLKNFESKYEDAVNSATAAVAAATATNATGDPVDTATTQALVEINAIEQQLQTEETALAILKTSDKVTKMDLKVAEITAIEGRCIAIFGNVKTTFDNFATKLLDENELLCVWVDGQEKPVQGAQREASHPAVAWTTSSPPQHHARVCAKCS